MLERKPAVALLCAGGIALFFFVAHLLASSTSTAYNRVWKTNPNISTQLSDPQKMANAAIVVLARNSDLHNLLLSMTSFEDRFNARYGYDYVFLNDQPFSKEFKALTTAATHSNCKYGQVPKEQWEEPPFIDQEMAKQVRENATYIYGDSQAYRRMCRFQSGMFFRHKLLQSYDWYWRLEPSVKFFCDFHYDPFQVMIERNKIYGWNVALFEIPQTIPTLWDTTKKFMKEYPQYIAKHNALPFVSDDNGETYNMCHFWSNFEIASLNWLRSKPYMTYFDYLDRAGGFSYERWGDAPVHSIAASLLLEIDQIQWFDDIGYQHDEIKFCPENAAERRCRCDPSQSYYTWTGQCKDKFAKLLAE